MGDENNTDDKNKEEEIKRQKEKAEQEESERRKKESIESSRQDGADATLSPIERAEIAGKRLQEQNDRMEKNIKKIETFQANQMLQGRASAGEPPKQKETDEEKWAREAKLRYAGTGMDPT